MPFSPSLVLNLWSEEMKEYIFSTLKSDGEDSPPHFICLHIDELIRDIVMCIQRFIPEVSQK